MTNLIDLIEKGSGQAAAELTGRADEVRTLIEESIAQLPHMDRDVKVERDGAYLLQKFVDLFTKEV